LNRGTLNSHAINTRAIRGGAFRVAADLVSEAFVTIRSSVVRRMGGTVAATADIGPVVGRVGVRSTYEVVAEAGIVVNAVPLLRSVFACLCEAAIESSARAGRRAVVAFAAQSQIDLAAYALLRGSTDFRVFAALPSNLKSLRSSPVSFGLPAAITLKAGILNEFPYDEDAPDDRVFQVAAEENVFYVVV
jgi:hypothetical protein